MKKIELEFELRRLQKQKKTLLQATTYSITLESRQAISSLLKSTNENITRINGLLYDLENEDKGE